VRILVINVNTTASMTRAIGAQAVAAASSDTEITAATPRFGPASVESIFESHLAAVGVIDCAQRQAEGHDAVILAGFGELGREALQEMLDIPVIDITEAAAHVACLLGKSFGVVTTTDRAIPAIEDRLLIDGLRSRCVGVRAVERPVLEIGDDLALTVDEIVRVGSGLIHDEGAEALCLGCAGMAGLSQRVSDVLHVPVVDGVAAAVRLAESVHHLGLRTSKIRFYAPSPDKAIAGWRFIPSAGDETSGDG